VASANRAVRGDLSEGALMCDCVDDVDSSDVRGKTVTLRSFLLADMFLSMSNSVCFFGDFLRFDRRDQLFGTRVKQLRIYGDEMEAG
jgi:hypothetical protein